MLACDSDDVGGGSGAGKAGNLSSVLVQDQRRDSPEPDLAKMSGRSSAFSFINRMVGAKALATLVNSWAT